MAQQNKFRLQSILNFKSSIVDSIEVEFAHLKLAYQHELSILHNLQETTQRQAETLQERQQQLSLDCQTIEQHQKYLQFLHLNITQQTERVAVAKDRMDAKRDELVKMIQDKKTLENLRQQHIARETEDMLKRENRIIDDLVTTRYAREGLSHV